MKTSRMISLWVACVILGWTANNLVAFYQSANTPPFYMTVWDTVHRRYMWPTLGPTLKITGDTAASTIGARVDCVLPRMVREQFIMPAAATSPYTVTIAHLMAPGTLPIVDCYDILGDGVAVPQQADYTRKEFAIQFNEATFQRPQPIGILYWTLEP